MLLSNLRFERRHYLWIIGAAVLLGLLLFLVVLSRNRQPEFYKASPGAQAPAAQDAEFEPLPAPAAGQETVGLPPAPIKPTGQPAEIIETRPPPPAQTAQPPSAPPISRPPAPVHVGNSAPVPVSSPSPEYPRAALRAGIEGMVRVQVEVGPDGVPTDTSLATSSGNRDLDRAALQAVRRWRFKPAMFNGQPSVGRVVVPINFKTSE